MPALRTSLVGRLMLALTGVALVSTSICSADAGYADEPESRPTTSAPAGLAPSNRIIEMLESPDVERQLAGFAAWHTWRLRHRSRERRLASAFLSDERWLTLLGNEVVYDMESPERRLTAYRLLAGIGGQRVFPYFLWGRSSETHDASRLILGRSFSQDDCIRDFFAQQGDPTVIEQLTEWSYTDTIQRIQRRWNDKPAPAKNWEALDESKFHDELTSKDPLKRRLAVRAITVHPPHDETKLCEKLGPMLTDSDPLIVQTVVGALAQTPCPELRARLKAMVQDDALPPALRQGSLRALAACGLAPEWTAEWMIDHLPEWPKDMDAVVQECLIEMRPREGYSLLQYRQTLKRNLESLKDPRARAVVRKACDKL